MGVSGYSSHSVPCRTTGAAAIGTRRRDRRRGASHSRHRAHVERTLTDRAPPARAGVSSSDSDPECPDSERRFAAGHVRLGRWPLPRIPSGVTCFAFSRQAYCGRAGPSLYQLHLVHARKGSSPLRGHSHPCCCRSVIFSPALLILRCAPLPHPSVCFR